MLAPVVLCISSANWLAAASIWRRLLMQALACEVARALTKFGIAMAARRPIMATTIMISTRVKPALRRFLVVFILFFLSFFGCGVNYATSGLYNYVSVHFHCPSQPHITSQSAMRLPVPLIGLCGAA